MHGWAANLDEDDLILLRADFDTATRRHRDTDEYLFGIGEGFEDLVEELQESFDIEFEFGDRGIKFRQDFGVFREIGIDGDIDEGEDVGALELFLGRLDALAADVFVQHQPQALAILVSHGNGTKARVPDVKIDKGVLEAETHGGVGDSEIEKLVFVYDGEDIFSLFVVLEDFA